jgi:hypothetical protein
LQKITGTNASSPKREKKCVTFVLIDEASANLVAVNRFKNHPRKLGFGGKTGSYQVSRCVMCVGTLGLLTARRLLFPVAPSRTNRFLNKENTSY